MCALRRTELSEIKRKGKRNTRGRVKGDCLIYVKYVREERMGEVRGDRRGERERENEER